MYRNVKQVQVIQFISFIYKFTLGLAGVARQGFQTRLYSLSDLG